MKAKSSQPLPLEVVPYSRYVSVHFGALIPFFFKTECLFFQLTGQFELLLRESKKKIKKSNLYTGLKVFIFI